MSGHLVPSAPRVQSPPPEAPNALIVYQPFALTPLPNKMEQLLTSMFGQLAWTVTLWTSQDDEARFQHHLRPFQEQLDGMHSLLATISAPL